MTASINAADVTVYWRPGCPFCMALRASLKTARIDATWINIWEDEEAADVVRAANNGNETVPTVVVGDQTMTNPSLGQVKKALAASAG
ncbi:glutaredoxin family protein [Demetria terragena]|uniref:glutaredoxin family protein n=1 Tax=Demetria terragena TaxID=63959 RepID=UPI0003622590|nr:glutaredoxin domain-containing protein [Demetria terragena]